MHGVARIVGGRVSRQPVVVTSALSGVTDLLDRAFTAAAAGRHDEVDPILADVERRHRWAVDGLGLAGGARHALELDLDGRFSDLRARIRSVRILGEGTPRARDGVLAEGEQCASRILVAALVAAGLDARHVDPQDVMPTDDAFGAARPDLVRLPERAGERLRPLLAAGAVPVTGGFVGQSPAGETTTLGRGGSDTSAAMLGLALGAEEVEIWTDVDGLMTADPRRVAGARTLPRVSFACAAELASCGARVLHPHAVAPAVAQRIPVRVLNSLCPGASGTLIVDAVEGLGEEGPVAVASREVAAVLVVRDRRLRPDGALAARVLDTVARHGVAVHLAVAIHGGLTLAAGPVPPGADLAAALGPDLELEVRRDRALIGIVGPGVARPPVLGRVLRELVERPLELLALGPAGISVVALVDVVDLSATLTHLHHRFFEEAPVP